MKCLDKLDLSIGCEIYYTDGEYDGFEVQVDGVHDDEDLLVLVHQTRRLPEGRLAVVLDPTVLAQERGRQAQW